MANTIITIEIATLMHAALKPLVVVPEAAAVYARGVKTDQEGAADPGAIELERKCPMVDIIPSERRPLFHNSVLRAYPVRVRVMTYGPHDPFQIDLYTMAHAVSEWLCSAPTLALTLADFDALVMEGEPDTGNTGENETIQYMEWLLTINTRKA
tara:strand:+ start:687 stop:1148 length:462 start_codon:yes stop_codon:yes gene_type:complete